MKEETLFEVIWGFIKHPHFDESTPVGLPLTMIRLVEYKEPSVYQYDKLVKEGPFEVHLFHANLSVDPLSMLQAMITCNQ